MRLPRITKVYTIEFCLTSGSKMQCDFQKLGYDIDGGRISHLYWTADAKGKIFFVAIKQIECINTLRTRSRIRLRHK